MTAKTMLLAITSFMLLWTPASLLISRALLRTTLSREELAIALNIAINMLAGLAFGHLICLLLRK